ncbi:TetR/AcrR family transcriptional regulator [Nocardia donostiensis]|uniref:TetR family transcriptional regulator n=1 Tax=Nocardia donostiensis TaxID=1538463 RepID=A0A1V2TGP8_9NOCA|nr:TetR/AcrR family transcriptional regulator [Nocardia donostiensis]ONM48689.1 TetR family transcriptional regulator [Nocardia donostiensis]OQS16879.1 TetR family transcriptional regulator [Nocardia donostiensis]OQS17755.1 TetR family transcriptional regulator [Nocardia donostiensis]
MSDINDRRVRRTRDALHRALIELTMERGYERVTVSDIIDRADVGRSTFYAHYRDKDELLFVSCTDFVRREIAKAHRDGDSLFAPVRVMIGLAATYPDVYRPLIGPKCSGAVLRGYRQAVASLLHEHLDSRLDMPADELDATITFLSWGLIGLLVSVIDCHSPTPPENAWRSFELLCRSGLAHRAVPG